MKKNKLTKITTLLILIVIISTSCEKSDCTYDDTESNAECFANESNTLRAGFTVATCYAANVNDPVGVIYDTQMNSNAIPGDDWGTTVTAIHPTSWTASNIGQVFGIAIDKDENIYLAASHVYAQGVTPVPIQNSAPAQIYKCSPPLWAATPLLSLPNTGTGNLNGTGNIAYDKVNHQLFITNLEDGKIYRYNTSGVQQGAAFDPWIVDDGSAGIVNQDERVWGIGVNYESGNVKVYFPRITVAGVRSIYSITLNNDGSFPTGTNPETIEINNILGNQRSITDIAFSSDTNKMLLAERGNAHSALTQSYVRTGSTWSYNLQYYVGGLTFSTLDGKNTAGGVDFASGEDNGNLSAKCDDFFWATGNWIDANSISGKVYGLEGIKFTGNNPVTATTLPNKDTDLFIDLNGIYTAVEKNTIGDVEVFDVDECFDICN
ncbi:MAG: hypothetical protein V3U80_02235 [Flavobacteriaceae bacterium]